MLTLCSVNDVGEALRVWHVFSYSVMFLYVCVSNAITIVHTAKDGGRAQKGKETIFFYVWLKKMDFFFL